MKPMAALLLVFSAAAQQPDPLLWGSLRPGPYQAGFRSAFEFDSSRQYDADYVPDASRPHIRKPRPILADIWYPARANQQPRLHYREYFDLPSDPAASAFAGRLSRFARATASEDIFHGRAPAQLSKDQVAAFERFLSTTVFAAKDAPPAEGRFPVVIYHSGAGGSFEDNSALFEYLASNGYVVISSAYQSQDSSYVGNNRGNSVKSIRDMAFLAAFAATLPFADAHHLGAIGHSAGEQAILQWLGEPDCPVDAAVSLDTTVEYRGLKSDPLLKKALEANEGRPRVPILLFATAERHPNFGTWDDYLLFAARYFASMDRLSHDDYLMHGAIYGSADIRRGYDRVCALTLQFLDGWLKQDRKSRAALRKEPEIRYQAPAPAMLSARQIAAIVQTDGIAQWNGIARGLEPELYRNSLEQACVLLLEEQRFDDALALQHAYAAKFPKPYIAQLVLGQIQAARGQNDLAAAAFARAQQLLNADRRLPPMLKAIYAEQIKIALDSPGLR